MNRKYKQACMPVGTFSAQYQALYTFKINLTVGVNQGLVTYKKFATKKRLNEIDANLARLAREAYEEWKRNHEAPNWTLEERHGHHSREHDLIFKPDREDKRPLPEIIGALKSRFQEAINKCYRKYSVPGFVANILMYSKVNMSKDTDESDIRPVPIGTLMQRGVTLNYIRDGRLLNVLINECVTKYNAMCHKEGKISPPTPSDFIYHDAESISFHIAFVHKRAGGKYHPLPDRIKNKKACINIQNKDEMCFALCIVAALHLPRTHRTRAQQYYEYLKELNLTGISFPISDKDIDKFERQNPTIAVNILLAGDNDAIEPYRVSHSDESATPITLLKHGDHFVLVTNINKLMNKHGKRSYHWCLNCMDSFSTTEELHTHQISGCFNHPPRIDILCKPGHESIKFTEHYMTRMVPNVIVADFESIVVPTNHNDNNPSGTTSKQVACGFFYLAINENNEIGWTRHFTGEGAEIKFIDALTKDAHQIFDEYEDAKPNMVDDNYAEYNNTTSCAVCNEPFDEHDKSVLFNHMTGKYIGAAHLKCRFSYRNTNARLPVFFHNGANYDTHLFMGELTKHFNPHIIPKTTDEYINISVEMDNRDRAMIEYPDGPPDDDEAELRRFKRLAKGPTVSFMDSCKHLASSLDSLVSNTAADGLNNFKFCKQRYGKNLKDFTRKGVYPYEHMKDWASLEENQLPPKSAFHSSLAHRVGEELSDKDYRYAKYMAKKYCSHGPHPLMRLYHDMYLESDVYLLADIISNYRRVSMAHYQIDPAWVLTAPALAWHAMKRRVLNDGTEIMAFNNKQKDMLLMCEDGKRGGISGIINRYFKATDAMVAYYLDANNLYGWAMIQPLPMGDYQWDDAADFTPEAIAEIDTFADRGYILEVDLRVPNHLHEYLRDYPPAFEHCVITDDMLSPFTKNMKAEFDLKEDRSEKLIMSLRDKSKYVIHYRLLQHYMDLGVEVTKVHRVMSFHQEAWLADYIMFNSNMRTQVTSDVDRNFFKLLNNSIYGKLIENVRKRASIALFTDESSELTPAQVAKLKDCRTLISGDDGSLVAYTFESYKCKLDKPIAIGQAILDLSKLHMSQSFYAIKQRYDGDKTPEELRSSAEVRLLMTDTDSLLMQLPKRFEDDLAHDEEFRDMFDFSKYPKDHPFYSDTNNSVVGKFKNEMVSKPDKKTGIITVRKIDEFIGLRSKMYSIKAIDENGIAEDATVSHAKGVHKVPMKDIKHENYREALFDHVNTNVEYDSLRSRNHVVYSVHTNKIGLSAYDNKFYQLDNINSVPYGYTGKELRSLQTLD